MGFYVSALRNVPADRFNHYIYVVDCSGGSIHTSWINENLDLIGQDIGSGAGIISGPDDLSREVFDFLCHELEDGFGDVENLLHSSTCLLIADNVLNESYRNIFLVPLSSGGTDDNELHEYMNQVIDGIVDAISTGKFSSYLEKNSVASFKLKQKGELLVDSANSIIELKPNIAGIGLNVNALIERIFKR